MLTLFVDMVLSFDGQEYWAGDAFIRFVQALAERVGKVTLIARVHPKRSRSVYRLDPQRFAVIGLPYYPSLYSPNPSPLLRAVYFLWARRDQLTTPLLLSGPHPLGVLLGWWARKARRPYALLVRQNLTEMVRARYTGIHRTIAVTIAALLERSWIALGRHAPVLTVGPEMADYYRSRGVPAAEIYISLFQSTELNPHGPQPRQLGEPLRIITVSRLEPEKGLRDLVHAVRIAVTSGVKVYWEIVGEGSCGPALRELVQVAGLGNCVSFVGYVPNGPQLLEKIRHAHVLVVSSLTEGFPQAVLEAFSQGTPVLATAVGGMARKLRNEIDSLLVPPQSPEALAEALMRLYYDDGLRVRLGQNGRRVAETLTLERQVERVLSLLASEWNIRFDDVEERLPCG